MLSTANKFYESSAVCDECRKAACEDCDFADIGEHCLRLGYGQLLCHTCFASARAYKAAETRARNRQAAAEAARPCRTYDDRPISDL